MINIKEELINIFDEISDNTGRQMGKNSEVSICIGINSLDNMLKDVNKGSLLYLGGRPGVRKTTLALEIALATALKTEKKICIFSYEESRKQLLYRMFFMLSGVDLRKCFDEEKITDTDWDKLVESYRMLQKTDIYIEDSVDDRSPNDVKEKVKNIGDIELIIIDYISLMRADSETEQSCLSGYERLYEITTELKKLSRDFNIPIICLGYLGRNIESKKGIPNLDDLYETNLSTVADEADIVMLLYKNNYRLENYKQDSFGLNVCKNLLGEEGVVELKWNKDRRKFENCLDNEEVSDEFKLN